MVQQACQLQTGSEGRAVAPFWHTRALTLSLLAVALSGTMLDSSTPRVSSATWAGSYGPVLLVNVGLAFYVARLGLERSVFWRLVGCNRRRLTYHLAWAVALLGFIFGVESFLQLCLGMPESLAARNLLPRLWSEKASWTLLALVIGASEELVYRGYLRQQLRALSGSAWLAILLQALLFGIAHGAQGPWAVARFAAYGVAFGHVAEREHSIVPGVLCHVGLDLYAGWAL